MDATNHGRNSISSGRRSRLCVRTHELLCERARACSLRVIAYEYVCVRIYVCMYDTHTHTQTHVIEREADVCVCL